RWLRAELSRRQADAGPLCRDGSQRRKNHGRLLLRRRRARAAAAHYGTGGRQPAWRGRRAGCPAGAARRRGGNGMIIVVYSETYKGVLSKRIGESEYSYYFVLKEFRPVLERIGLVVAVADPANEVD